MKFEGFHGLFLIKHCDLSRFPSPLRHQIFQTSAWTRVRHHDGCSQLRHLCIAHSSRFVGEPPGNTHAADHCHAALRERFGPGWRQPSAQHWPSQYRHHRAARLQQHRQHRLLQRRVKPASHRLLRSGLRQSPVHGRPNGRAGALAGGKECRERTVQQVPVSIARKLPATAMRPKRQSRGFTLGETCSR